MSFVLLGMWQLRRHDEKSELRHSVAAAFDAALVPIGDVPAGAFMRVVVHGEYTPPEAKVLRSRDGVSGYEVLTPLVLDDGTAVLADRGWAPLDVDHLEGGSAPIGGVEVTGILWPPEDGGESVTELPEFVKRADPSLFAAASGLEFRHEYLVVTAQSPPFGDALRPPEIGQVSLGPHLGYAGQWFLFAAVVLVGYPLLIRRRAGPATTRE